MRTIVICTILACSLNLLHGQHRLKINPIRVDSSFDDVSLSKLNQAKLILDTLLNSERFADAVRHTDFKVGNFNLTSDDILNVILSGRDNYKDKPDDYSMDLRVRVTDAYEGGGNFGTTDMSTRITRTHRCYILYNDLACYVSHLAHEYMHQVGFYDDRTWFLGTKTESVPYKIGNIVNNLLGNETPCLAKDQTCTKN